MAVDGEVALFSMIKWLCFQLSRCKQDGPNGPLFGDQMALFSVDKNTLPWLRHGASCSKLARSECTLVATTCSGRKRQLPSNAFGIA